MAELDGVREECGFGNLVDDVEAAVVLGGVANIESIAASVIPGCTGRGLVVDEDATAQGADGGGVVVEGAVEILPG